MALIVLQKLTKGKRVGVLAPAYRLQATGEVLFCSRFSLVPVLFPRPIVMDSE